MFAALGGRSASTCGCVYPSHSIISHPVVQVSGQCHEATLTVPFASRRGSAAGQVHRQDAGSLWPHWARSRSFWADPELAQNCGAAPCKRCVVRAHRPCAVCVPFGQRLPWFTSGSHGEPMASAKGAFASRRAASILHENEGTRSSGVRSKGRAYFLNRVPLVRLQPGPPLNPPRTALGSLQP
jgi:hypothetical protein